MSFYNRDESIFGFDYNQDGKIDFDDDVLHVLRMEQEEEEELSRRRADFDSLLDGMDDEEIVEEFDLDTDDFDANDCDFDF